MNESKGNHMRQKSFFPWRSNANDENVFVKIVMFDVLSFSITHVFFLYM